MSKWRRYEILLPLRFNDGRPVPAQYVREIIEELRQRFGGVSCDSQTVYGEWESRGQIYRDELVRIYTEAVESVDDSRFFADLKERLKKKFDQLDIRMTHYLIEVM